MWPENSLDHIPVVKFISVHICMCTCDTFEHVGCVCGGEGGGMESCAVCGREKDIPETFYLKSSGMVRQN